MLFRFDVFVKKQGERMRWFHAFRCEEEMRSYLAQNPPTQPTTYFILDLETGEQQKISILPPQRPC